MSKKEPRFTLPPEVEALPPMGTPEGAADAPTPPPSVRSVSPAPAPTTRRAAGPSSADPAAAGRSALLFLGVPVGLVALLAVAFVLLRADPEPPAPEPAPPPVEAPAPAPVVAVEPAEPEPEPEPEPPSELPWEALEPKIQREYAPWLARWFERGGDPPTEADQPGVIALIRTDGYVPRDVEIPGPNGRTTLLKGKSMPRLEYPGDVLELSPDGLAVEVFNPVYAPKSLALTERWTLDGVPARVAEHEVSASFCYGLRSTTRLAGDVPDGATLTLALVLADSEAPLAERSWTVRRSAVP